MVREFLIMLTHTDSFYLYIDPATGSMLFSVLVGVFITAGFFLRLFLIKIKTVLGGKAALQQAKDYNRFLLYSDDKRYWNSFEPILDEFEKRKIDVAFWTSSEDDPVFSKEYKHVHPEFIGKGNKSFVKLNAARADVLLSTTPGLDVLQWKRSRGVKKYVLFFHTVGTALLYRMFQLDFYDVILSTSDFIAEEIRTLEKVRNLPAKEISVVGTPYFDVLSRKIRNAVKPSNSNKVILLAPTWGPESFLYKIGDELIQSLIDTGYDIVFRPHPQSFTADKDILDSIRERFDGCTNFSWNTDNDNFDILNKADLLISDFSGVIFDFTLLFNKPIMYTTVEGFDDSVFDYAWVKGNLWIFDVLPSLGCEITEESLKDIKTRIDETISSAKYKQGINEARDYAWKCQGCAAEKIVDYVVKLQSGLAETPEKK